MTHRPEDSYIYEAKSIIGLCQILFAITVNISFIVYCLVVTAVLPACLELEREDNPGQTYI